MFDIKQFPEIISHLQFYSSVFTDKGNELIVFCPYCDDATRKVNPTHGHCYIANNMPVFHCFRCGASGSLVRLLIFTGFENTDIIEYLSKISNYKGIKSTYVKTRQYITNNK